MSTFEDQIDKILLENYEKSMPYFRCSNPSDEHYTNVAVVGEGPDQYEKVKAFLGTKFAEVIWRPDPLPLWRLHACDGTKIYVPRSWPTHWLPA